MLELLLCYYYYYRLSQLTTDNETYTTTKLTRKDRKDIEHIVVSLPELRRRHLRRVFFRRRSGYCLLVRFERIESLRILTDCVVSFS